MLEDLLGLENRVSWIEVRTEGPDFNTYKVEGNLVFTRDGLGHWYIYDPDSNIVYKQDTDS